MGRFNEVFTLVIWGGEGTQQWKLKKKNAYVLKIAMY